MSLSEVARVGTPHGGKGSAERSHERRVGGDHHVLLVGSNPLHAPVKAAIQELGVINHTELVVHVVLGLVMDHPDACILQPPSQACIRV